MNQAVTVGMIVWPMLVILGIVGVLGVIAVILTIIDDGFKH